MLRKQSQQGHTLMLRIAWLNLPYKARCVSSQNKITLLLSISGALAAANAETLMLLRCKISASFGCSCKGSAASSELRPAGFYQGCSACPSEN